MRKKTQLKKNMDMLLRTRRYKPMKLADVWGLSYPTATKKIDDPYYMTINELILLTQYVNYVEYNDNITMYNMINDNINELYNINENDVPYDNIIRK